MHGRIGQQLRLKQKKKKNKKTKTENALELKTWTCIQKDTLWYYVSSPMSQLSFVCVFVIIWTFILMNFDVLVDVD